MRCRPFVPQPASRRGAVDTEAIVHGTEVPVLSRGERRAQTESIKIIPTG